MDVDETGWETFELTDLNEIQLNQYLTLVGRQAAPLTFPSLKGRWWLKSIEPLPGRRARVRLLDAGPETAKIIPFARAKKA